MSVLGYSLLPFVFLAILAIFTDLKNVLGGAVSVAMIAWSTVTASRYFEYGLDMEDKKYLIAYPISLFYFVFMLLTLFWDATKPLDLSHDKRLLIIEFD